MIFWYAAGAVFLVWNVFQSPGLDMRFVAIGALLLASAVVLAIQVWRHVPVSFAERTHSPGRNPVAA